MTVTVYSVLLVSRLEGFNCIASSCAVLLVSRLEGFNCIASSCVCVCVEAHSDSFAGDAI